MKSNFPLSVAASWARVVAVFVVDVAVIAAGAAAAGRPGWWVGVGLTVLITVLVLLCWRGAPLLSLLWRSVTGRRPRVGAAGELADYERRFGSGPVGIRAVGPHLVAVVAVDGPPHSPSVLDYPRVESLAKLPLEAGAAGLDQFDVHLEGIDIVSVGARRAPKTHHPYAPVYSAEVGDHPAVGQRRTWLVVRFNALQSARAIVWRESVAATMSAAAEWLAAELTSLRIPSRVLSAAQIRAADEALLAGIDPTGLASGWGRLRHAGGYVQTYWMSPGDISSTAIDRLWAPDTDATAVSVQLRRADNGATTAGVMVRYHTGGPLPEPPLTGLNPLVGRHDAGLAAGLLTAATGGLNLPARELAAGEKVAVPIGATGIIVGTTASGHPLLVDLHDPTELATVTIAGEFALLVQVALRAAATGYQVLICTKQPQRWQQVTGVGLQMVGAAGLAEQLPPSQYPYVVVYDRVGGPTPAGAAVTIRTVGARSASGADIHIEQDGRGAAVIRTWAFQYRLRINLDYERRLIDAGPRRAA
ncbi:type VII secretion protein EccE [Mycobacterium intracellulare]|uniref:type VII secretion protein EccE n=1 Tax=Mycobacterium intracellulare TaxID=1767 RepID=UPI00109E4033|nr:type VII secretion protein EccE [Mycobacterium intracellulare]